MPITRLMNAHLFIGLLLFGCLLSGCSADTPSPLTPPPIPTLPLPPTPTNNTLLIWHALPPAQARFLAAETVLFTERQADYQIELRPYQTTEAVMQGVQQRELYFDVILAPAPLLRPLWQTGQIAPLADHFEADFQASFAPVTVEGAVGKGQRWAIPDSAGFHLLLFYNPTRLTEPPAVMADLFAATQPTDPPAIAFNSYDPLWLIPWIGPHGGLFQAEQTPPRLNQPAIEAALTRYLAWHRSPAMLPPPTYEAMRQTFQTGQLPLMVDGSWAINELSQIETLDWQVAPLPDLIVAGERRSPSPLVLGRYWAMSRAAQGQRAEVAAAFIRFVTRPERQLTWFEQFGLLPTRVAALEQLQREADPISRVSVSQLLDGQALPLEVDVNRLLEAMRQPLRHALSGQLTPQQAAQAMQQNWEQ